MDSVSPCRTLKKNKSFGRLWPKKVNGDAIRWAPINYLCVDQLPGCLLKKFAPNTGGETADLQNSATQNLC